MKKHSGFTLVELMITIAIVAILLTVAVPSIKTFRQSNSLIAASNDLISAFNIARSEAIKLNQRVTICSSSDGTSCSDSAEWKDGWIVFVDADGNFEGTELVCDAVGTDCLLRIHEAIGGGLTIVGVDENDNDIVKMTFTSRGMPKDISGISQSAIFNICSLDDDGATVESRAVVLGLSGRVRVSDNTAVITQCPS